MLSNYKESERKGVWQNFTRFQILAMIEEAAGTRMYEAKKQQAQKTIEKKDAKLKEINDVRHMF